MPHGLGHYVGLYVHDLTGLKSKDKNWVPIPKMKFSIKRNLEANMVITCEPGIYLNNKLIK